MDIVTFTRTVFAVSAAFVTAGLALLVLRSLRPRERRAGTLRFDLVVTGCIGAAVFVAAWIEGTRNAANLQTPPSARTYRAEVQAGRWLFSLSDDPAPVPDVLWVEVGAAISVLLAGRDAGGGGVCFAIDTMRVHRDVPEDRYQMVGLTPMALGDFAIAPFAGCAHGAATPRATLRVVDAATFAQAPWRR